MVFVFALTQFPRIYLWVNSLEPEHGPQFLRLRSLAQNIDTRERKLPKLYITSDYPLESNIALMASGNTHWLIANPAFIETLSDEKLSEILEVAQELFFHTVTQRASLLSALQYFLFFLPWTHHRGNELSFYSLRQNHKWARLLFEQSLNPAPKTPIPRYLAPNLLFPVLTNYNKTSYYSLYVYLRDQWIAQTKKELYQPEEI